MNKKMILASSIVILMITVGYFFFNSYQNSNNKEKEEPEQFILDYIYIDLKGEVNRPNVYKIFNNLRLYELIEIAGGFTDNADINAVNLTQILEDGQMIMIPQKINNENTSNKVNINKANINEFITLPNIGPATATAIINYRNKNGLFNKIEDIKKVSGIGEATFEKIKDYIFIE